MQKFILSIDQGTTGTTAILIDSSDFSIVGKVNKEFPQIYPEPGWVEHNLDDIWNSVEQTVTKVLNNCNSNGKNIIAIGITNQRETTCAFYPNGTPITNAIVWQDRRTYKRCYELSEHADFIKKTTGLPVDPYFSGTKMEWLLKNSAPVKKAAEEKMLKFGTIDTFLLYKLTGNTSYKTDATNASRTLLMDLESSSWNNKLLDLFKLSRDMLPEICDSTSNFGVTENLSFLPDGIPITGILGDQQAALFGHAGITKGDSKCTYGTGAFMLTNTGDKPLFSNHGLLTTVAYKHKNKLHYALEGSSFICGAAIQWLRDNLKIIKTSPEVENLALDVKTLEEMKEIFFLPFFAGMGSPYWKPEARGAILGLTRGTTNAHIARATLEGISFAINDLISAMSSDLNQKITELKVDGGATSDNLLMEIQANISELNIIRPQIIETTAYGAALASAVGIDLLTMDKLKDFWKIDKIFTKQNENAKYYKEKKESWSKLINKLFII